MSLWILDTDLLSLLLRGHAGVAARFPDQSPDEFAISVVTMEEFWS